MAIALSKRLSPGTQTLLLIVAYTIIILGTMFLSGQFSTGKTIYDRYQVRNEGVVIHSKEYDRTVAFYTQVLEFTPIVSTASPIPKVIGFDTPGNRKLFLSITPNAPSGSSAANAPTVSGNTAVVFMVKNGFAQFHQQIVERSGADAVETTAERYLDVLQQMPDGRATTVVHQPWGQEFAVKDPDGNLLIFYRPNLFSRGRQ